jgi:hypothetical protein
MNETLAYRRQFFIGPADLPGFPSWKRLMIARAGAGKLHLAVHPDLGLTHVAAGGKSLTLLGYLLDPDRPEATDRTILERLLGELEASAADLPRRTSRLGGRFALIVHDGARTVIFQDAGGLRQVYFTARPDGVACAAQSGLLAEVFGLSPDPAALDYLRSRGDRDTEVYWLPGDRSAFEPVRALLPNHLLDLDTGTVSRFWPTDAAPGTGRARLSADAGLRESAVLLEGQVDAARRRYPLAVAMTAGWDSRLMLALTKEARGAGLYCYTLIYPNATVHSRDVWVPGKLLKRLGLRHHVLRYPETVDSAFKAVARRSSSAVHPPYCADVQALRDDYPSDHVCLTGDVAEVVKVHYRLEGKSSTLETLTVGDLGAVAKVEPHPFADAAFASWLEGARKIGAKALGDVNILDVFNWEQMAGRWQGQIRAEYDIVHESFAPLACRELLLTMLAVDERERRAPAFPLFRALIERAWPELLAVPINPKEKLRWRRAVVGVLRRLRIYDLVPQRAKDLGKRIVRKIA